MELPERFKLVRKLGKGGMGEVYLVRDQAANNDFVAIKRIVASSMEAENALARFLKEIATQMSLESPYVVESKEVITGSQSVFCVMEYLEGGTLRDLIKDEPLGVPEGISILKGVLLGLKDIHQKGLVHRDIKPENIFFTKNREVKIGDFGLAREPGSLSLTQDHVVLGTAMFVPPEYIETGESDHRGDLYALGVCAYEMLTGSLPYPASPAQATLAAKFKPVPLGPLVNSKLPTELIALITKLLDFRVTRRIQSAEEALEFLG